MARLVDPPTTQQINDMLERVASGDPNAVKWVQDQNRAISKRANERMRYMESKSEIVKGSSAYDRAQYYLQEEQGSNRFYSGTARDIDEIAENLREASNFLRGKDSTMRGRLSKMDRIYDKLEENGYIDVPEDPNEEARFKRNMNRFFQSEAWQDLKKSIGSGDALAQAGEAIESGLRVGDLTRMFKESQAREDVDIFDVWDSWTQGHRKIQT